MFILVITTLPTSNNFSNLLIKSVKLEKNQGLSSQHYHQNCENQMQSSPKGSNKVGYGLIFDRLLKNIFFYVFSYRSATSNNTSDIKWERREVNRRLNWTTEKNDVINAKDGPIGKALRYGED